ncbi:MAG: hypothetical protein JNL84_09125 [Candidatus Accumulibacter sp.]|nr:hypothetical protein [Accumulibacter sp.]
MMPERVETASPIHLFLIEVSGMDARLIGMSLERHMKGRVVLTNDLLHAHAVLIDCDRRGAEQAVLRLPPRKDLGIVGYALNPPEFSTRFPGMPVIAKPLNLESLWAALTQAIGNPIRPSPPPAPVAVTAPIAEEATKTLGDNIETDDGVELCGAFEDLPTTRPSRLPDKLFFDPDDYLVGQLFRAVVKSQASQRPLAVAGLYRLIRVVLKPVPLCLTAFRETRLRPISMTQLPLATTRIVHDPGTQDPPGTELAWATEDMLWNVAAWAARGRLPVGTDPYRPVRLKAWPNFTRVFVPPHALRIAALWVRGYASPIDIATRLGIPQRYVFSFYTAAQFAGLINFEPLSLAANRPAPPPATPVVAPSAKRPSLLARILKKLINAV